MNVLIEPGRLVVTLGKRIAHVPCMVEGAAAIVSLDEVAQWHEPAGQEISLPDLVRLTELIERAFDEAGREVEFE